METKSFFAVDLGATSGRTILGTINDGKVEMEELTRFDNSLIEATGHVYWDIYALYNEIIRGLKETASRGTPIASIGIDTWGVDMVCVGGDGRLLSNPIAYRDTYTQEAMDDYVENIADRKAIYDITGIQFMNFNTLFQLHAMRREGNSALKAAEKVLFIPDALTYMLTGKAVCEYTIASTSQMLNPCTKDLDNSLIESVGLRRSQFGDMVMPGTIIGTLTEEVQRITGLNAVPVVAVAGHDTASAVAAVPAADERFAYLSSGTWSLLGIETRQPIINENSYRLNFTNEGGIDGTTRFLKNICGMWIYERCRKEWADAPKSHSELQAEAMKQPAFRSMINPDDPLFANPRSMLGAIKEYCEKTGQLVPVNYAQTCRCIFESLALRYRQVFEWLNTMAGFPVSTLHVIGGGSLNNYLNQFTADSLGVEVLAGPVECTTIGNIMMQTKAAGMVKDIWDMRRIIADSYTLRRFSPCTDRQIWNEAYKKFIEITKQQ